MSSALASRRRAAAASQAVAAQAAADALTRGNAIDAVAAGVLAAAGESPGVLLGPIQILMGGAGAGLRAVDGRARQPGLGQSRPRGFREDDVVAPAARVGTPALPAALAAALALGSGGSLARAMGPAVAIARATSPERAAVLQRLARHGAAALGDGPVRAELLAVAGRVAGGLLGEADLEAAIPDVAAATTSRGSIDVATVPWGARAVHDGDAATHDASAVEIVAAADGRGLVAIACYEVAAEGVAIDALGLLAPFTAAPVRRGEPRAKPGSIRAAAAPIALGLRDSLVEVALGVARALDAERLAGDALRAISDDALATGALSRSGAGSLVAILRTRESARVLVDARRA